MIATSNAEQNISSTVEVSSLNVDEKPQSESPSENNESYSSEKTLDTSISNTSPNTPETIANIENNFKPAKNNPHFYDQSMMNGYQPNYGYGFCPPQFYGFDNPQINNFGYQFVNPYYDYQQQMMFYPNYPAYFPADFSPNWNSYGPKNFYQDNQRKYRNNNNNTNTNTNNINQKMNQNADGNSYQQRRYKKPFNRRGENQKPEEEKPKIVDYDLMKNQQVYVDAFPALEPNSGEKTSQPSAQQDENNSTDEAKGVNKENELSRVNSVGWSGKKWSEIVNGKQMLPEYHEANGSKQKDIGESSLEKQINGLNIQDIQCNSETCSQKSERTNSKKSNYKKNNYDPNYYYNQNSQNFDYYMQQQFYNDYKNFYAPKIDIDNSIIDSLNPSEFCYAGEQEGAKDSRFFVIKSNSRDDVLHSIKHGIWCSTKYGNNKLNQAFLDKKSHASIYLFFSVNTSGMFSGMAEMTSQVDFDTKSELWTQDKWKGKFDLKWTFVKDVPNSKLKHITLPNNENKPVTHSRDAQEIPFDSGVEMLNIFRSYKHMSTLLDNQFDLYQADSYMYNLMFHFYAAQARYSKYHYRSSDYKWKNPAQNKENNATCSMSDTGNDQKDCASTNESADAPAN